MPTGVYVRRFPNAQKGKRPHNWNGGRGRSDGYWKVQALNHPRAQQGYVPEHILITEHALGKPLPVNACVHHVDENGLNNENSNLVICENNRYHRLLHVRLRVLKAGGDPNTDKICSSCKAVKSKSEFGSHAGKGDGLNDACKFCNSAKTRAYFVRQALKARSKRDGI